MRMYQPWKLRKESRRLGPLRPGVGTSERESERESRRLGALCPGVGTRERESARESRGASAHFALV